MTKILTLGLALLLSQPTGAVTAQEQKPRNLSHYAEVRPILLSWGVGLEEHEKLLEQARGFLWSNWQEKRRAHVAVQDCTIYPEGCDDHKTYNFFIEPDEHGRWRLLLEAARVVLDRPAEGRKAETSRYEDIVYTAVERVEAGKEVPCRPLFREEPTVRPNTYRLRLTQHDDGKKRAAGSCALF